MKTNFVGTELAATEIGSIAIISVTHGLCLLQGCIIPRVGIVTGTPVTLCGGRGYPLQYLCIIETDKENNKYKIGTGLNNKKHCRLPSSLSRCERRCTVILRAILQHVQLGGTRYKSYVGARGSGPGRRGPKGCAASATIPTCTAGRYQRGSRQTRYA